MRIGRICRRRIRSRSSPKHKRPKTNTTLIWRNTRKPQITGNTLNICMSLKRNTLISLMVSQPQNCSIIVPPRSYIACHPRGPCLTLTEASDKEGAKRIKLAEVGGGNQNGTAASATGNRASRSRSGSGSEGQPGSEQPLGQHMRFESTASATNPRPVTTPASYYASVDESAHSPSSLGPDRSSQERSPVVNASPRDLSSIVHRGSGWLEDSRSDQAGMQRQLPPLSGVFDQRSGPSSAAPSSEVNGFPFPRTRGVGSPGPPPGLFGGEHRPKTLSKEQSWTDSSSSGSSYGYPRTPIEGPLVIHSLLSAKPDQQHEPMPLFYGNPTPPDHTAPFLEQGVSSNPMPHAHGAVQRTTFNTGPPPPMVPQLPPPQRPSADGYSAQFRPQHGAKPEPNLDGMSALLRAGEIVDRRTR